MFSESFSIKRPLCKRFFKINFKSKLLADFLRSTNRPNCCDEFRPRLSGQQKVFAVFSVFQIGRQLHRGLRQVAGNSLAAVLWQHHQIHYFQHRIYFVVFELVEVRLSRDQVLVEAFYVRGLAIFSKNFEIIWFIWCRFFLLRQTRKKKFHFEFKQKMFIESVKFLVLALKFCSHIRKNKIFTQRKLKTSRNIFDNFLIILWLLKWNIFDIFLLFYNYLKYLETWKKLYPVFWEFCG